VLCDEPIDHGRQLPERPDVGYVLGRNGHTHGIFELEQELEIAQRVDADVLKREVGIHRPRLRAELALCELPDDCECVHVEE